MPDRRDDRCHGGRKLSYRKPAATQRLAIGTPFTATFLARIVVPVLLPRWFEDAHQVQDARGDPEAGVRQVKILFVDIAGRMMLADGNDP